MALQTLCQILSSLSPTLQPRTPNLRTKQRGVSRPPPQHEEEMVTFKAKPMPSQSPFQVRPSKKQLAVPKTPNMPGTQLHKLYKQRFEEQLRKEKMLLVSHFVDSPRIKNDRSSSSILVCSILFVYQDDSA